MSISDYQLVVANDLAQFNRTCSDLVRQGYIPFEGHLAGRVEGSVYTQYSQAFVKPK